MEDPRQENNLERQGQGSRQVQVMLARTPGEQERRYQQYRALDREQVDERHDAPLREHGKGQQQQECGTEVQ